MSKGPSEFAEQVAIPFRPGRGSEGSRSGAAARVSFPSAPSGDFPSPGNELFFPASVELGNCNNPPTPTPQAAKTKHRSGAQLYLRGRLSTKVFLEQFKRGKMSAGTPVAVYGLTVPAGDVAVEADGGIPFPATVSVSFMSMGNN